MFLKHMLSKIGSLSSNLKNLERVSSTLWNQPNANVHRFSKVVYPWMDKKKDYWVKKDPDRRLDIDLSFENRKFMEEHWREEWLKAQESSPLLDNPWPRHTWTPRVTQRCGVVAVKLGIYPMWTKTGKRINCTLLQVLDNHALRWVPPSQISRYLSLQDMRPYMPHKSMLPSWITQKRWGIQLVGAVCADPREFTPAWNGLFREAGVPPKRHISRFFVSSDAALQPGTPLSVGHFRVGDYVDITARSVNRGFQGVIERWGMKGGPKTHGSTKFHRKMGSAAGGGKKIRRGKRMPGVMGNRFRTSRASQIVRINPEHGIIYVRGATVGPNHCYANINDTWMAHRRILLNSNPPPMPTFYPQDLENDPLMEGDQFHECLERFDDPSIVYEED